MHAADQQASDGVALHAVEAEAGEAWVDAQPAHGGEASGFDPDGTGAGELQRGDIDLGVNRVWRGRHGGRLGLNDRRCGWGLGSRRSGGGSGSGMGRDKAGGIALGQDLDGFGFREHARLSGEPGVDPSAQARPVVLGQLEMATEVEQGDLTDLLAGAFGGDEAKGEIGFLS
jgi:hypothetical protein